MSNLVSLFCVQWCLKVLTCCFSSSEQTHLSITDHNDCQCKVCNRRGSLALFSFRVCCFLCIIKILLQHGFTSLNIVQVKLHAAHTVGSDVPAQQCGGIVKASALAAAAFVSMKPLGHFQCHLESTCHCKQNEVTHHSSMSSTTYAFFHSITSV